MVTSKGIAVIGGTGQQGFGLALRWARAGQRVLISSRQASKAVAAAGKITEIAGDAVQAEGLENSEAVSRTNLVVLTVPFEAQAPILKGLKGSFKPGHILIDVTVPLESAVGGSLTRVMSVWAGSAAEQAALLAGPQVGVASAFHNIGAPALNDIEGMKCQMPKGTFYVFPNIGGICESLGIVEAYGAMTPEVQARTSPSGMFQMFLLYRYGVATLDRNSFGSIGAEGHHYLRLSIATSMDNCQEGVARIVTAATDRDGFARFLEEEKLWER